MIKKTTPIVGAHFSIGGGFANAIRDAQSIDANAIQIFLHSNRQWAMQDLTASKIEPFLVAAQKSNIKSYIAHSSYLINLGSDKKDLRDKSLTTLIKELEMAEQLQLDYLVMHPGNYGQGDPKNSITSIALGIELALKKAKGEVMLLVENTAGAGTSVGGRLESLKAIRDAIKEQKNRVGFCFDTCHGFAAGYDFTTPKNYEAFWNYYNDVLGIENLKAFHMNDSKRELASHVDRHADIGKGKIGIEAFRLLMNDERITYIPKILETPYTTYGQDALVRYKENINTLLLLIK